ARSAQPGNPREPGFFWRSFETPRSVRPVNRDIDCMDGFLRSNFTRMEQECI
ncbi:unnamed protein product, partial [Ascophyllum nodosum]